MFRTIKIALLLSIAASVVHAEDQPKNEIGLLLGGTATPAIDLANGGVIDVGAGITFQMTYARQLAQTDTVGLYLEFPAVAIPLQDLSASPGSTPLNYDSFFITPAVRVKFRPNAALSPWFSAGGGYALFEESDERRDGSHNTTRGTSTGALQFGAGLDFRTPVNILIPIGLRAEVRDFYTGKPTYNVSTGGGLQHNLAFSGGLVLSF